MESIPTQANQPLAARQPLARFGIGTAGVLLANVGFLSFFLVYDLSLYQLVLIYWCECFWVGVFSFLKLLVASLIGDPFANRHVHVSRGSSLFFSVIAAWFTSGLFFFLFALLGFLVFSPAFDSADAHGVQLEHLGFILGASLLLAAGHAISFIANFLVLGEFKQARFAQLLALPFKRCLAMLGAVIIAFAVMLALPDIATSTVFAAILIMLKVVADYRLHCAERATMRRAVY